MARQDSHQTHHQTDVASPTQNKPKWFIYLIRLLVTALVAMILLVSLLFYMAGTQRGSQFLLDKIVSETGVHLSYQQGNLRDGVWVSDIDIDAGKDITVHVDKAYVQLGWRAIFSRQVHLVNPQINTIKIHNKKAPTGEPFDYTTIATPVSLYLDNVSIKHLYYTQKDGTPFEMHNIQGEKVTWTDSKVQVSDTRLDYGDVLDVRQANGWIDLSGDYPLKLDADINILALEKVYFDRLSVKADGTLKRTVGKVASRYNGYEVAGEFVAQGLDEGLPFHASLDFDQVVLPYAEEQHITLSKGKIIADGVVSDIELRIDTDLVGKDIPQGRYRGRGIVRDGGMDIPFLQAHTPSGVLTANGKMQWSDEFELDAHITGDKFKIRQVMPAEYADYQAYLPEYLDGSLSMRYELLNQAGDTKFAFKLRQKDGEHINATLAQQQNQANAPWRIQADWQHLKRHHVPQLDVIDSRAGNVSIRLEEGKTYIQAMADIDELHAAPKGHYQLTANIDKGERIHITDLDYQGVMGDLTGVASIDFATTHQPLTWRANLHTKKLLPNAYLGDNKTPIEQLTGHLVAAGRMREDKGVTVHEVQLSDGDLSARIKQNDEWHSVHIVGKSEATLHLKNNELQHFSASFSGQTQQSMFPQLDTANLDIRASGNLSKLTIEQGNVVSKHGDIQATGELDLTDGIGWNIKAKLHKFNTSKLLDDQRFAVLMSGDVMSTGAYRNEKLQSASARFNLDASDIHSPASAQTVGVASLDAKGEISWDIKAALNQFNTAKFIDDEHLLAVVSGNVSSRGSFYQDKISELSVDFDGNVINKNLPEGKLKLTATGKNNHFVIDKIEHTGVAGDLQVSGWVDVSKGVAWDIQARLAGFNAGKFVKNLNSQLTGVLNSRGHWQEHNQKIIIDKMDIQGMLNGQPMSAKGSFIAELSLPKDINAYLDNLKKSATKANTRQGILALRGQLDRNARQIQSIIHTIRADNLHIKLGDNQLKMHGNDEQIITSINITDLGQIIDKTRGVIQGGLIIINDGQALPTLYVDMNLSQVRTPGLVVQEAQAIGKIVNLGNEVSQLLVQGSDIIVMGKVIKSARIDFAGTQDNHILTASTKNADIEAQTTIQGSFHQKTMRYSGVLRDSRVSSKFGVLAQKQPTEFSYGLNDNSVQLAAHCWQTGKNIYDGQGVLCLQDTLVLSPNQGNVNLVVQNLDTQIFSAALPGDIQWYSLLNGRAKVQWQQGKTPTVDAVLYSDDGRIGLSQDDTGYVEMPYKQVSFFAKSVPTGLQIHTDVAGVAGVGYADITLNPYQDSKPITGDLMLSQMNLAVLRPFFPSLQTLTGKIDVAGKLGGTLRQPLFHGQASLSDGALAIAGVPMALQNIQAAAQIDGNHALLSGEFDAGQGQGVLTGELDWQKDIQAKMSITGQGLEVNKPPVVTAKINPDFEIIVRPMQKYVDIQGVVSIPQAILRPPETTAQIVGESEDVSVLDRRLGGNVDKILAVVEPWSINANIGVDLGNQVEFRGFGAKLPLAGALHLTQVGRGVMQARGVVQVSERTKIDGIGQNLELNYAQIRFNRDLLNPQLSIEGEKQIEGQTIGVRIRGTASSPAITVFNDAGLTEQQAMNALVTGRLSQSADAQITEQGFRSQVTNQLAAAGLSFGLSGTRNLTNQIGQALGLQSLTLDASGSASDTNVNVTGYITPDLYIRYGIGVFNAESSLSMRYQLTRRVFIEATSATENLVDVIYRWKF
ncbi:translocation/assembly module TamB domain-containing protein [Moraxella sp.]|uniref:translocation/assembly module TamB domain-containing protein n=1 Tax=Moraxella sp. TaxID=479 RepID=UPI0026DCACAC|nr:translocation/assembly module TamB domain-containing protein [Moraxella sp.]MDO4895342.1 translocation/assembly module TamB domain-containing protein [Moraxella sp.]